MGYDFNPDDYGMDQGQWMGGEALPTDALPSSDLYSGSQALPAGLDSYSSGGSAIQKFLEALRASNQGQSQVPSQPGSNMADLGSVLGAFSSGEKANRFMKGNFTQNYDKLMLDAQTGRNENESDALKKLAQTSYIKDGGSKFKAPTISLNGKSYHTPDLGFGPPPVTEAEKAGASVLQPQLQSRLMPGGSYTPQPLSDYADPGLAEKLSSYGGAGVSGLGTIQSMLGGGQSGGNELTSLLQGVSKGAGAAGTIGKLLSGFSNSGGEGGAASAAGNVLGTVGKYAGPVAGAALGTYGLAKNASVGSDVMSGVGAGASIGSFAGPIGTGIGAGVGALVGALRGAFSVTGKEHSGRDTQAQITQNLSKLATPQQVADSKKAGWPDPNQALALIVMRDKLLQSGLPGPQAEAQAESIMHGMWNGEKGGSQDVAKAFSPIQSMMAGSNPITGQTNPFTQPTQSSGAPSYPAGTDAFSRGAYRG